MRGLAGLEKLSRTIICRLDGLATSYLRHTDLSLIDFFFARCFVFGFQRGALAFARHSLPCSTERFCSAVGRCKG